MTEQRVSFPTITDEALAALRALVGKEIRRPEPYIEVTTRDAVRHWAHGIGDRNPYWAEAKVAPPTILFALDRIVSGYVGRPARHPRHVRRHRLPLAPGHPRGRARGRPQRPPRPRGEAIVLREACHQADLPDHLPGRWRRHPRRGGLLVLPHRARHRPRAQEVCADRAVPLRGGGDRPHPPGLRARRRSAEPFPVSGTTWPWARPCPKS